MTKLYWGKWSNWTNYIKGLWSIYPTNKFYVICIKYDILHALYSNFDLYSSKEILKHLPSVQYTIILNAIGHIS